MVKLRLLLVVVLVVVSVPGAHAQCYLLNANSKCEVCWKTVYGDFTDKIGVTTMDECPSTIVETWDKPLPQEMVALQEYMVDYSLSLDLTKIEIVKQGDNHVPHANIHSCIAAKGACTPFVSDSPGLATHTEALVGSIDKTGRATFTSAVKLTVEQYTIIAHIRFYVKDNNHPEAPAIKYDVAIGASRIVTRPTAAVSADSWITTGIVVALLVMFMVSIVWATRSGRINFDKIIETIYSDEVTVTSDILIGIGDTAAYTLGVFTVISVDYKLIQILPAAYMFMAIAWIGSLYNAYYDIHQLWDVYMQHHHEGRFFNGVAKKLAHKTVTKAVRSGRKASVSGIDLGGHNADQTMLMLQESIISNSENEKEKQEATMEYEMAVRELRRKRGDVVTIFSESMPITIIQSYIMLNGGKVQIMTILILLFSSVVFGAKLAGLGVYKTVRLHKDTAEKKFQEVFEIVMDPTCPAEIKRQRTLSLLVDPKKKKQSLSYGVPPFGMAGNKVAPDSPDKNYVADGNPISRETSAPALNYIAAAEPSDSVEIDAGGSRNGGGRDGGWVVNDL
eukprot:CAMPEP_0179427360 /NCGR_PEP_ID=MMETSP0799-20121207/13335_1 /TAXON_ID=46947 /ORGANISM="Geminigera cryophila, Strain CCMP2564" /LENGTH=561 /DNA_ID=CAMNT_0021202383 /DNA_START=95 /DNA_END=1780 /DNA_ORIENTATION=+